MQFVRELTLDINPKARIQTVDVKQNDTDTNVFTITIINSVDNTMLDVSGKTVNFRCIKPSGYGCLYECAVNSNGTVNLVLSAASTAESGLVLADISIEENDTILSTAAFWMQVRKSGIPDHITEGNEYTELIDTINEAKELIIQLQGGGIIQCSDDGDGNVIIEFVPTPTS